MEIDVAYQVVTWNTEGERSAMACATLDAAVKMAKKCRTVENQSLKICDAFGTLYHWSRVVGVKSNRWFAQSVARDIFLPKE